MCIVDYQDWRVADHNIIMLYYIMRRTDIEIWIDSMHSDIRTLNIDSLEEPKRKFIIHSCSFLYR